MAALGGREVPPFQALGLPIDRGPDESRGRTRADPAGRSARMATGVDPAPVRQLLFERVLPWLAPVAACARCRARALSAARAASGPARPPPVPLHGGPLPGPPPEPKSPR